MPPPQLMHPQAVVDAVRGLAGRLVWYHCRRAQQGRHAATEWKQYAGFIEDQGERGGDLRFMIVRNESFTENLYGLAHIDEPRKRAEMPYRDPIPAYGWEYGGIRAACPFQLRVEKDGPTWNCPIGRRKESPSMGSGGE